MYALTVDERPNALLKFLSLYGRDDVVYAVLDPDFIFLRQIPERVVNNVKKGRTISAGYYRYAGMYHIMYARLIAEYLGCSE